MFREERIDEPHRGHHERSPDDGGDDSAPEPFEAGRQDREEDDVEKADEDGQRQVSDGADQQAERAEMNERLNPGDRQARNTGGGEKIDRIPDAVVFKKPPRARQNSHHEAAGQPAFDAGEIRVNGHREAEPVPTFAEVHVLDPSVRALDGSGPLGFGNDVHVFMLWMWKNIAEPANGPDQPGEEAHSGNDQAGDQAGKNQAQAEGGDDRPAGRRGKFDFVGVFGHVSSGR